MSLFARIRSKWAKEFPHGFFITRNNTQSVVSSTERDTVLCSVIPIEKIDDGETTTTTTTVNTKTGESVTSTFKATNIREFGGVYIGGFWTIANQVGIHEGDVKSIVTVVADLGPFARTYQKSTTRLKNALNIEVSRLPWRDCEDQVIEREDIAAVLKYIHKRREVGGVLVHCIAGRSRSAVIVLSYMLAQKKVADKTGMNACYDDVRGAREEIKINDSFMSQLTVLVEEGFFAADDILT